MPLAPRIWRPPRRSRRSSDVRRAAPATRRSVSRRPSNRRPRRPSHPRRAERRRRSVSPGGRHRRPPGTPPCAKVESLMSSSVPFRDTFWNVPGWAQVALYVGGALAIAIFAYGMWQRVSLWRRGLPEDRLDQIPKRLRRVLTHAVGQVRTLSQAYPGVMHAIMFWGFLALFMGTVLATLDWDVTLPLFGYKLLKGPFYLFYETVLDMFGLFFVVGLGMAVWRRFVQRPARGDATPRFAWVPALLLVINVDRLVMEACRVAAVRHRWQPMLPD